MRYSYKLVGPIFVICFFMSACVHADVKSSISGSATEVQAVPVKYVRTSEFLEALKYAAIPDQKFELRSAPNWNVKKLMEFISEDGVTFSDVNDNSNHYYSKPEIQASLSKRTGPVFENIAHLAFIYSHPYKQYSELNFSDTPDGVIVHISGWYDLRFKQEDGRLQLTSCSYIQLESE